MTENILWVPALVFLLGTLVFFHEFGHFTAAKLLRIRVEEFAFGFGPKWIRLFKRGDTEYTIHPVPLGGFVKLAGGDPGEEDVPDGFFSKPWYARFAVYLAGPLTSFALAYLVFSLLGITVGLPITGKATNRVYLVQPDSLAQKAGLRTGDLIVKIDGQVTQTGGQVVEIIHRSPNKLLELFIKRNGKMIVIRATPRLGRLDGKSMGLLGFALTPDLTRVGLVESVRFGTRAATGFIVALPKALFNKEVAKNIGGPIAIASETRTSVRNGPVGFMQLMAVLSMSLGVFNLLPIPLVDGGQMMLLLVEAVKRRRLSRRTLEIAQMVGIAMIATLFIAIMFLDLSKVVSGELFR